MQISLSQRAADRMTRRRAIRNSPTLEQIEEQRKHAKLNVLFSMPPFTDPRIKGDFRVWEGAYAALQRSDDGSAHVAAMILIRVIEQMCAEYKAEHVIEALRNIADDMEEAIRPEGS